MKKILIALDYASTAQRVGETGYELAKAMNATAILLHVITDVTQYSYLEYSPIMGFGGFGNIAISERDTTEELKKMAQEYLEKSKIHLGDHTIQTVVKTGNCGEAILKAATDMNADIIVMGTHSRKGLEKLIVGSVAENVLHHSSIPILIIPTRAKDKEKIKSTSEIDKTSD